MDGTLTARDARQMSETYPAHTSGSRELDGLLGGGYRAGKVVEIYGESGSGKTQLAMQAVLEVASVGEVGVIIDSEGAFRPERVAVMARARGFPASGLLERIVYLRVRTAAEQTDSVRALSRSTKTVSAKLVAIDTVTRNFSLDFPGRRNLQSRQGALDVHLSEIARDAFLHGRAYVLTNRVTFSQAGGDARIGGRTMEQLVHVSVHLEKGRGGIAATRTSDGMVARLGQVLDAGLP